MSINLAVDRAWRLQSEPPWVRRLAPPADAARRFARTVEICRAILGLVLLHQFAGVYGAAGLYDGNLADATRIRAMVAMALAAGLLLGAATPIAAGALIAFLATEQTISSLGSYVAVLSLWGLILLGAGRAHSADAALQKHLSWTGVRRLYAFAIDWSPRSVASVRLSLLIGYWGLCLNAMGHHLLDSHWTRGSTVWLLYLSPYWSDHYRFAQLLQERWPLVFQVSCTTMLLVQSLWEMLLVPLLSKESGRRFCGAFGWMFFLVSLTTVNLGYLPYFESILWLLLFPPTELAWRESRVLNRPREELTSANGTSCASYRPLASLSVAIAVIASATSLVLHNPLLPRVAIIAPDGNLYHSLNRVCKFFGQGDVNVFNGRDIARIGQTVLVLAETDGAGNTLRLVPYMDSQGGRLAYFRNDVVLYRFSVQWHATFDAATFGDSNLVGNGVHADYLARRLCLFDACVRSAVGPKRYRAQLLTRALKGPPESCEWSPLQVRLDWPICFEASEVTQARSHFGPSFVLPPRHQFERSRTQLTLQSLQKPAPSTSDSP
jgi:hypothetical protein